MRKLLPSLLVALAGLAAFYYFFELRGRQAREVQMRLLPFDEGRVEEIAVVKKGDRVVVRRTQDGWELVEPLQAKGDASAIQGLLYYLSRLRKERDLGEEPRALAEFGLDDPFATLRLRLQGNPTPLALSLGGRSRLGDYVYAAYEGAPGVFLVPATLRDELGKTPYAYQLRDKTLLAFDDQRVTGLEIERGNVRIRLQRREGAGWAILSPFKAPADHGIVADLIWKIRQTRVVQFMDGGGDDSAPYGLGRPEIRLRIWEDGRHTRTLALWDPGQTPGAVYVRVEPPGTLSLVEGRLKGDLSLDPDLLRNRLLFAVDDRQLAGIEIRHADRVIAVSRTDGRWTVQGSKPEEADEHRVRDLVESVKHLRFRSVHSVAAADLARYGLAPPRLELTLRLTDGRMLPRLAVGRREGEQYYALLAGSPSVYSVDANLIKKIPARPEELRRLSTEEKLKRSWEETREFLESLKR